MQEWLSKALHLMCCQTLQGEDQGVANQCGHVESIEKRHPPLSAVSPSDPFLGGRPAATGLLLVSSGKVSYLSPSILSLHTPILSQYRGNSQKPRRKTSLPPVVRKGSKLRF